MHPCAERPEQFVQHLPGKSGARDNQRLAGYFFKRNFGTVCQWIFRAHHQAQPVAINVMDFEVRRLQRQADDADVHGTIFDALQNFVAEIAIDADVHERILALELRENFRQQIQTGRLVGAEYHRALHNVAAIRDDLDGLVTQTEQSFGVIKEHFAGRCQFNGFCGAIE